MLGGLSAGLIAPHVFSWVAEYPILIVLALLCRPGLDLPQGRERYVWIGAVAAGAIVLLLMNAASERLDDTAKTIAVLALLAAGVALWRRPLAVAAIVAFLLIGNIVDSEDASSETLRSFFGVHKISETANGDYRVLMHGTTIHGAQRITAADDDEDDDEEEDDDDKKPAEKDKTASDRPTPLTYYFDGSPLAQTIAAAREKAAGTVRLAVVGLGSGTLACQTRPGDKLTYYEIDPLVVRIARDPDRFGFLTSCAAEAQIVLGDARLTLADAADGAYDIIIVDAFSSDAIPIHLLTREAMALYARKISADGMVIMHLSNRHLELASVVAGIAQANGMVMRLDDDETDNTDDDEYRFESTVAAAARKDADFGALAASQHWVTKAADPHQPVWTDDYSNVVGAILRKLRLD